MGSVYMKFVHFCC